jgi:two-component system, OmpR family, sensor histidine kinase CiaH
MSLAPATAEGRLLRSTRWRLVAWSGGLTLAALVVLGGLIYLSVARSLESEARAELERRAVEVAPVVVRRGQLEPGGPISVPSEGPTVGVSFLGPASGSLALVVQPDGSVAGLSDLVEQLGLPDEEGIAAARTGATDVRTATVVGQPVRILSRPVETPAGTFVVQVLQDLGAEERALASLRTILLLGGLGVMAAAIALGWLYAGRALVPIRDSMRRQREFAADAGHELRNPLAIVKAAVEEARRQPMAVGVAGGPLDEIDLQADRLTELVDELLVFARMQAGTLELERVPLRMDEAVVAVVERLGPLARTAGVEVSAEVAPITVAGDRRRLEQLVGVLLDNAIRHSPRDGRVAVGLRASGAGIELAVEDRGPGIPAEELERVFDRYYRARTATAGGVGLGLAIARWITEGHGGSITAQNGDGGGARFVVRLPA